MKEFFGRIGLGFIFILIIIIVVASIAFFGEKLDFIGNPKLFIESVAKFIDGVSRVCLMYCLGAFLDD
jgi:hypothetical protein